MKTKYFAKADLDTDEKDSIKSIQEIEEDLFCLMETYLKERKSLPWSKEDNLKHLASLSSLPPQNLLKVYDDFLNLIYFLSDLQDEEITLIIEDIQLTHESIIIDKKKLQDRLDRINNLLTIYKPLIKKQRVRREGTPNLIGFDSTVIIKPVFEDRFKVGEMEIKNYKPKIINKVPCIIITLKNSNNEYFSLTMDSKNFEEFLNNLIALKIELKIAENEYS